MSDLIRREDALRALCNECSGIQDRCGIICGEKCGEVVGIEKIPAVDAEPVRHGRWILTAHDEGVNCRWNVTARCSECCDEENEIWAGFFPGVPDWLARDVALQDARQIKLSNYCPNCGARMDGGENE